MKPLLTILALFSIILLNSCEKKRGSAKACFNFSKSSVKVGDTVYLLNCSENYDKFIWYNPTLDSTNKHIMFSTTTAGNYPFLLRVGDRAFMSNSYGSANEITKTLTVTP